MEVSKVTVTPAPRTTVSMVAGEGRAVLPTYAGPLFEGELNQPCRSEEKHESRAALPLLSADRLLTI